MKVWNNLSYYLCTGKIHKYTVFPNRYLLSGITVTQTSPIQRHFISVRQPPSSPPTEKSYLWLRWATHNKHHDVPHCLPFLLPALLFLYNYQCPSFLHCLGSTALHVLEKHAQIVKHRGLQACPQAGCTVTHHSILWIGLLILHFPQLLCCSAVHSAQNIEPTAANQNRIIVKLSVVKLAWEHDQGTWKDFSGKISSFTISWILCQNISWADHTRFQCLPSSLFIHENSVHVLQPTDSCSCKITFSTCYSRNS